MATTAHTEVPGGSHKGAFPPFRPETFASQLLWLGITFVILYLMASRIALPRIGGIIEARRNQLEGDMAAAQRLQADAEAANAAYEKALTDARSRAQALANETREQQAAAAERERGVLEEQLDSRLAEAEKAIAATKAGAMSNVRGIAEDAASAIVARLIGVSPSGQVVSEAVADVLKR